VFADDGYRRADDAIKAKVVQRVSERAREQASLEALRDAGASTRRPTAARR
jgi:hypothetical protein